ANEAERGCEGRRRNGGLYAGARPAPSRQNLRVLRHTIGGTDAHSIGAWLTASKCAPHLPNQAKRVTVLSRAPPPKRAHGTFRRSIASIASIVVWDARPATREPSRRRCARRFAHGPDHSIPRRQQAIHGIGPRRPGWERSLGQGIWLSQPGMGHS